MEPKQLVPVFALAVATGLPLVGGCALFAKQADPEPPVYFNPAPPMTSPLPDEDATSTP